MDSETIGRSGHLSSRGARPRVLFLGMTGQASLPPLLALLAAEIPVVGVVVPGTRDAPLAALRPATLQRSELPLLTPFMGRSVVEVGWERGLPVWALGRPEAAETLATLGALHPDLLAVACFPLKLPPAFLALAPGGCLNVHPSRLPAHRGPMPLFWALRDGLTSTGVTVHLMDAGLDTGPIVCQGELPITPGISGEVLEQQAATLGGALLVRAVQGLADRSLGPRPQSDFPPPPRPYDPMPGPDDGIVTPDWSAERAYTFLRAASAWLHPLSVAVGARRWEVLQPLGYAPEESLAIPWHEAGNELWVGCNPGVLHLLVR